MSIACLALPHFALRVASMSQPRLEGQPLVLSTPDNARAAVLDATPEARTQGVHIGMTLREATALCPTAIVLESDPVRERSVANDIGAHLDRISPLVEPADTGIWFVDLTGLNRHYRDQDAIVRHLLAGVPDVLQARVGIGTGKFVTQIAAGVARAGTVRIIHPDDTRAFLDAAAIQWLPLPPDLIRQLLRLGIPTLGAFTRIPARKVAARFGPEAARAWDLACGHDDRAVVPPLRSLVVVEELAMPTPAVSRDMLMIGLRQMATHAFNRPELRNRHVRQLVIRALLEGDRRSWERVLTLKEPCGRDRTIDALRLRLQDLVMPGPVEFLSIEFSGIVSEAARQIPLAQFGSRDLAPLTAAVHHLKHRYGESPLAHVVEVEPWSRIPERRYGLVTYDP